jgi:phosphatidylserine/phosphatidylglycerophosphate/cardiolipin synthase-like enzyme
MPDTIKDSAVGAELEPLHINFADGGGMDYAMCPEQAEWAQAQILALVDGATQSLTVGIFGYDWPELTDAIIAAHKRGVATLVVLDRTQAAGIGERDLVAETIAAGVETYIGTSPEHAIRHSKYIVVDGVRGESGSLNYSIVGFSQNNTVEVFSYAPLAARLTADIKDNVSWLIANEPAYNTPPGHPALPGVSATKAN